jgi:hypothetical protein
MALMDGINGQHPLLMVNDIINDDIKSGSGRKEN